MDPNAVKRIVQKNKSSKMKRPNNAINSDTGPVGAGLPSLLHPAILTVEPPPARLWLTYLQLVKRAGQHFLGLCIDFINGFVLWRVLWGRRLPCRGIPLSGPFPPALAGDAMDPFSTVLPTLPFHGFTGSRLRTCTTSLAFQDRKRSSAHPFLLIRGMLAGADAGGIP